MKNNKYLIMIGIGIVSFAIDYAVNPTRAWHGYLMSYYFISSIALGGIFFAATQHLTSAGWSATMRRIPESMIAFAPWALLLFLPLILGGNSIYEWMHADVVAKDPVLAMKTKYLNVPFFLVRAAGFFIMWYFIGGKLVKNSLKQDTVGGAELTKNNVKWSAIFMPLFALLFSFFSVDLIMSLDPHWYSTMFGVRCFASLFLSSLAATVIILCDLKQQGKFGDKVNENHIQNVGLLMFGFVIFYAYVAFSEFMLIWYANLPEETQYYIKRWENGWSLVAIGIVFIKFLIPFLGMLPRRMKREPALVKKWAYWILAACWLDVYWMVMPNFSAKPIWPIYEFGILIGFVGVFKFAVARFLNSHPVVPVKDPRLPEALHYHQ